MAIDAQNERYELVEVDGRVCLFTNLRLDRSSIPEELYCYDVRDSDRLDGSFAQLKQYVLVNHWGTLLSKEAFPLDEMGAYYPKEEEAYLGAALSLAEYQAMDLEADREQLDGELQQMV